MSFSEKEFACIQILLINKQVLYVIREVIKTLQMNIEERMNGGITY